jgi:uncharacterized protein YdaU (DUF1376 family)
VNYFELHVGDYDAATAHLTMLEDAAYGRMLRIYYRTEKPLPVDVKQVCRLVRAQSKPERDAVQTVLDEFFSLEADGWHQARADAELQRFQAAEPEREQRKANEDARLERHRKERQALFKLLNDNGQHAPWNTKIEELRRLAAPYSNEPETPPATEAATQPATAPATPATATHGNVSPPPTSHYPVPKGEEGEKAPQPPAAVAAPSPRPERGTRLPAGWSPGPEQTAFAESLGIRNGVAAAELEKFRDYWAALPGQKGVKTDWTATWRNWLRRKAEDMGGKPGASGGDIFAGAE